MTDQNDQLLLALGWTQGVGSIGQRTWRDADGELVTPDPDWPRPYDNLQDAVDLVPEGWSTSNVYQDTDVGKWLWMLESEDREVFKWAKTPAEALAAAIMKAVKEPAQ